MVTMIAAVLIFALVLVVVIVAIWRGRINEAKFSWQTLAAVVTVMGFVFTLIIVLIQNSDDPPEPIANTAVSLPTQAAAPAAVISTIVVVIATPVPAHTPTSLPPTPTEILPTEAPTPVPATEPKVVPTSIEDPEPPPTTVPQRLILTIEDFEYDSINELLGRYQINAPGNELYPELTDASRARNGLHALGMRYKILDDPPSDYVGMEHDISQVADWRNFSELCLWIQNENYTGHFVVQFREYGGEVWKYPIQLRNITASDICIPLTTQYFFQAEHSSNQNGELDLGAIDNFAFYLGSGGRTEGVVYVDNVRLE